MELNELVNSLNMIDVWDCHGVLKNSKWGVGKGHKPDIAKLGLKWIDIEYFTIPIPKNINIDKEAKKQITEVLFLAINRSGAINLSGWYDFYPIDRKRLLKAFEHKLKPVCPELLVDPVINLLKRNPKHILLVYSSAFTMKCTDNCQGYHSSSYIYWDNEANSFAYFNIGAHHSYYPMMWNINPKTISTKKAKEKIRDRIEMDIELEEIFIGEEEDYINRLNDELAKLYYCKIHKQFYTEYDPCPFCY